MNTSDLLRFRFLSLLAVAAIWCDGSSIARADAVKSSEQDLAIPTYLAGDPEPNPMFYFGQGSQGAEGRVYPYPLYDTLTNIKSNKLYRIVYLENEYVRIGILPEVGGRLFEAKFQWAHARDLKPDPEDLPKIETKLKNGLPEETSSQAKAGKKSGDGG